MFISCSVHSLNQHQMFQNIVIDSGVILYRIVSICFIRLHLLHVHLYSNNLPLVLSRKYTNCPVWYRNTSCSFMEKKQNKNKTKKNPPPKNKTTKNQLIPNLECKKFLNNDSNTNVQHMEGKTCLSKDSHLLNFIRLGRHFSVQCMEHRWCLWTRHLLNSSTNSPLQTTQCWTKI